MKWTVEAHKGYETPKVLEIEADTVRVVGDYLVFTRYNETIVAIVFQPDAVFSEDWKA